MEKRIYNENFEQFLKETVDDFRMYPSRKVWHSIYNDIHPSKKWPSLAVLLLLVSSLMFIGVNNTNKGVELAYNQDNNPANPLILEEMPSGRSVPASSFAKASAPSTAGRAKATEETGNSAETVNVIADENPLSFVRGNLNYENENTNEELDLGLTGMVGERELRFREISKGKLARMMAMNDVAGVNDAATSLTETQSTTDENSTADLNQKKKKKKKGSFAYQIYATPSVGFRSLSKNTNYVPLNPSASMLTNTADEEPALSHSSAVNIETGANVMYNLSGFMRIKAGIQVNYTNYHINAYPLHHPSVANLLVNNAQPMLVSRMTTLSTQANGEAQNLNNNTYQFSVPVGADFMLAKNGRMQWFAGATIQPTFVTGGNAFLISADRKNYISDPTMLRRFNMNGGIETFISYKVGSGVTLNAGPQFRYQLLSSYDDQYTYDEKLYNLGLKLGVTTTF